MSRLAFGPEPDKMEVTDISTGHFVFAPVGGEKVSYEALDQAIVDAGYEIEAAAVVVSGIFAENWHLETPDDQTFHLTAGDEELEARLRELEPPTGLTVRGAWKPGEGAEGVERIVVREILEEQRERSGGGEPR